ncbi:MAG: hypothetical protein EOO90_18050 [Pedobacter sp.]|nr:MAG: hypothetical protein EOO90_18050 [Pedobacter sp.]
MKIALVTYEYKASQDSSNLTHEDDSLISYLQEKDFTIDKVIWNDAEVIWENYDLVVLKSPWDYFNLIDKFYAWLNDLQNRKITLLNPIEIVKWNANKNYLSDIDAQGLKIAPCLFLKTGEKVELEQYFKKLGVEKLIVKPVVSGGSKNTFKVTLTNLEEVNVKLNKLLENEEFIVQPFLEEVERNGEWSFIFFGGKFSHALIKKAKAGDFRVQHSHGGTIHPQTPSIELIETAKEYVDHFAKDCLYARVDGVFVNDEFLLMELELIEPYLFLDTDSKSLENYHKALSTFI